jgi:UDP-N-acetylglucosamine 2-epimerase (non-hydrolysing)
MLVVGARPNFMKAGPLIKELKKHPDKYQISFVHTGQHYDHNLSELFFKQLDLPRPDINLGVGSGSHAEQTAHIMIELERLIIGRQPDMVVVFGDVNSPLAAAVVTSKLQVGLAHVEAGLRSFDNSMPEEINRIVTDRLSDLLFVSENSGMTNLHKEGIDQDKIFFVGNIMIDSLIGHLEMAEKSEILGQLSLEPRQYALMTLHRPANVDNRQVLSKLLKGIEEIGREIPVIFPCHPRTRKEMTEFSIADDFDRKALRMIEPLGYLDFLRLQSQSAFVLTDSGGIQEETTYLNIPCITLRNNTERPVTVEIGSNTVTGANPEKIMPVVKSILNGHGKTGKRPELWDGKTAERIVGIFLKKL